MCLELEAGVSKDFVQFVSNSCLLHLTCNIMLFPSDPKVPASLCGLQENLPISLEDSIEYTPI